jgi:peroxiredoxin
MAWQREVLRRGRKRGEVKFAVCHSHSLRHAFGMAATSSTMLALGTAAPHFTLPDVADGKTVAIDDFHDCEALLVIFLCAHCPYVHHVAPELARLARDYMGKRVAIVGITANDIASYPQDAPVPTAQWAKNAGLSFPILFDESQAVAKAFTAACTPDFFLFGKDRRLVYRGQLDDSRPSRGADRPGRGELNGRDLRAALDATLNGQPVGEKQMPSIGCNIKWKPGNEPAYFG